MKLTDAEKAMFDGREGPAKQKAMDLLMRYGEALGAERLVETNNVAGAFNASTPSVRALVAKGFDAVEADEVDGWENATGFPISYQDQIDYNRSVASWIHDAGLSAVLKGDYNQAADLQPAFEADLTEEYFARFGDRHRLLANVNTPAEYAGLEALQSHKL